MEEGIKADPIREGYLWLQYLAKAYLEASPDLENLPEYRALKWELEQLGVSISSDD